MIKWLMTTAGGTCATLVTTPVLWPGPLMFAGQGTNSPAQHQVGCPWVPPYKEEE